VKSSEAAKKLIRDTVDRHPQSERPQTVPTAENTDLIVGPCVKSGRWSTFISVSTWNFKEFISRQLV